MGASKRRRAAFFKANPMCIFCGGAVQAETIEHCPPRAMFQNREWPVGFEFPACHQCNAGTANDDLLIALLARMDPLTDRGNEDGSLAGLMKNANKQFPSMFNNMMYTASAARRVNRKYGIVPSPGQTHQEAGGIRVTDEMDRAVQTLAAKLAKGVFYQATGSIFPSDGRLILNWFTNVEALKNGKYPVFEILRGLVGIAPPVLRSRKLLNDQFEYKYSLSEEGNLFVLQAKFAHAFGLVVIGAQQAEQLDLMMEKIKEKVGHDGPFKVLR